MSLGDNANGDAVAGAPTGAAGAAAPSTPTRTSAASGAPGDGQRPPAAGTVVGGDGGEAVVVPAAGGGGEPGASGGGGRPTAGGRPWWRSVLRSLGPALLVLLAQQVAFPAPAAIVVRGLIVGGLTALVALGMALIYRANRIVNFAQADLGYAPTVVAFLLLTESGVPYPVAVAVGLASAVTVGALTERVVIRRFAQSPRLLVTILTVGLSQVLAAGALLVPRLWDTRLIAGRVDPPFDATQRIGVLTFDANDLLALVATPVLVAVVATFLRSSDAGVAIRASADSADRASLLGVPVARLQTVVWSLAAALAFVAVFLRSGILELPTGTALGFSVLFRALAALLLGRMTDLPGVTAAALALGALELGVEWNHGFELIDPVLGVVVVIALIVRRREAASLSRADVAAWHAGEAVRPMPDLLARLPVVRIARFGALAVVGAVALAVPAVLPADDVFRASAMLIYALLGVSLVVLSGWAGTVSLGQVAFFAIGAAVAGALIVEQGIDLFPAMVAAAVVGAGVAALVGIPTLRLRGLYLAITTFALALATTSYLLNGRYFDWVPSGDRVERVPFLGGLRVETETEVYYLALVVLVAVIVGMRGVRTSRFGRALLALRDNERAAQAYAVDAARTQLAAFALAGGIAALAGALFVHHEQAFDRSSYSPIENLAVFTMVVVGGMGTTAGAVLGALFLLGGRWFLDTDWQFLASGIGVVVILLVAPSGLAGLMYRLRDAWLRTVARRRGIDVPAYSSTPADAAGAGLPTAPERPSAPAGPPAVSGASATEASPAPEPAGPAGRVRADGGATAEGPSAPGAAVEPTGPAVTDAAGSDASRTGSSPAATGADDLLLDARDIEVGYGGVPVLFGVDLAVPRGGAVALLGTNGAGKSTLLKAISGLAPPDAGRVVVDGVDLTGRPAHVVAAHGVAQMPGGHGVFPSLSVADNLRVAGWLRRRDRAAFDADVDRMRTLFPVLAERADDQAGHLSGGQQQMLALAMSVLTRPRLLMIDELSLGLAPAVVGQLLRFVDQLRVDGTTLVVVEQSVNVAVAVADTAVFMERGQVRFAGPAQGLLERPDLLRSVFLGAASAPAPAGGPASAAADPAAGPGQAPPVDAPSAAASAAGPSAEPPADTAATGASPVDASPEASTAGTSAAAAAGPSPSASPAAASVAGPGAAGPETDVGGTASGTASAAGTVPRAGAGPAAARDGGVAPAGGVGRGEGVPALRVAGVSVAFGGVQAVADVSFEVAPGEVVGVIGPNGAGKTTLFDLLSGFVSLGAGRIDLAGRDVTHLSAPQRARRGLGRSFQDARLFATMTVDEAIAVALERWVTVGDPLSAAFHLPSIVDSEHRVRRRVDQLVGLLGLTRYRSLFVGELSTGTRRVVDLACLLAHQPRVVLLDEPASGIAQREVEQLAPLIRRIRDETGASVVVVEHDIPLVEQVADRIVAMDQGRVVAIGPPAAVLSDPVVLRSYLGDDHAAIHRSGAPVPARPAETRG